MHDTIDDAYDYVAFIDEAGDPHIEAVRPVDEVGGSEWLVLSAVLVKRQRLGLISEWHPDLLAKLEMTQTNYIHFKNLNDRRRTSACRWIGERPLRVFVVASNKRTMRNHSNERAATRGGKQWFYNWMIRLLLERVTHYVARQSVRWHGEKKLLKVIFSRSGRHSYSQTAAYQEILNYQVRAKKLFLPRWQPDIEVLNRHSFENHHSKSTPWLQLPDICASAYYHAVDTLDGPCNASYAKLLKPRVAINSGGSHVDYGLVLQPTSKYPLSLPPEQREIFEFMGFSFDISGVVHKAPAVPERITVFAP